MPSGEAVGTILSPVSDAMLLNTQSPRETLAIYYKV